MSTSDCSMPGVFGIALCTLTISNNRLAKSPDQYFFLTRTAGQFREKHSSDERFVEQDYPYPGGNLFSLPSGGALFIRDPHRKVSSDQLNGGRLAEFTQRDCDLIRPFLKENEKLFRISVKNDLLTVQVRILDPSQVYRKIAPIALQELA